MKALFFSLLLLASSARAVTPVDQVARWREAKVRPERFIAIDKAIFLYQRTANRYAVIEHMRKNGVPAPLLFCLHMRESDNDFSRHAHEGSPLTHRTRDEPRGRLPAPAQPPFTFEQSAEDAYYVYERPTLDKIAWANTQAALDKLESFNGFGYRARGICAPYLWSGTTLYTRGKYVADGKYSATAVDKQLGCAAVLKRMLEKGVWAGFAE